MSNRQLESGTDRWNQSFNSTNQAKLSQFRLHLDLSRNQLVCIYIRTQTKLRKGGRQMRTTLY